MLSQSIPSHLLSRQMTSKNLVFTDVRHIRCGDLRWFSPTGEELSLTKPKEPQVTAYSIPDSMPRGIRLAAQPGTKLGPLPEDILLSRVIFDGGVYRSWTLDVKYPPADDHGVGSSVDPLKVEVLYRESNDGWGWKEIARSSVGIHGQTGLDGFTVFIDPAGRPEERYKAVYMAKPPRAEWPRLWKEYQKVHPRHQDIRLSDDYISCMYGAVSPDGIHWETIREPLLIHMSDTDTSVYYDSWSGKYVMYTRLYWQERRLIAMAEADDFRHWGPVSPLIWPDLDSSLSEDMYTNGRTEYPGLPGYHLMFPMTYHRYTQRSDVSLYSSADGICWNRVPGGPVIFPGNPGEWDCEHLSAGKDLVPYGSDRIGLLYGGTMYPHKYPRWDKVLRSMRMGWITWPKGRLSAVAADGDGEFFTFPLIPAGRELRINARTAVAGMIQVGIVGKEGRLAEECDPIVGDSLAHMAHWKGQSDIGVKDGEAITLHFKLRSAELFGLEWM